MSIIQEITPSVERAMKEWAADYRLHSALEMERVKGLPEFQEWAETVITPVRATDDGWIPGWNLEDCARKWVSEVGFDFPTPPIAAPSWAGPHIVALMVDEVEVRAAGEVDLEGGRSIKLTESVWVYPDEVSRELSLDLHGFTEQLTVQADELDDVIAALFAARHAITGTTLE